jgi:hypothetical protein
MIKFSCSHCGKNVTAPDHFAGKRGKCPGCQKAIQIPAAEADVESGFEVVDEESGFEVVDEEAVTAKPAVRAPVKAGTKATGIRAKPKDDDEIPMAEAAEDEEEERPRRKRRREVDDYDDEDDDYDDRPRRRRSRRGPRMGRSGYYTCPECSADAAQRVGFTWWGGFIGPMLFSHVSCRNCGTTYNGRSGKSNTTAIILYVTIPLVVGLMLAIIGGILGAFQ